MAKSVENSRRKVSDKSEKPGFGRLLLDAIAQAILSVVAFIFLFAWWLTRWSLAAVFVLAVMAGAGYYVIDQVLSGGQHVQVPDVTMRPITEASFQLAELGLEVGQQRNLADDRVPKYYVMAQRPPAGKVVRTGRKIDLTVSAGTESLAPPELVGKLLRDVENEVKRSAFHLGSVAWLADESPRGTILAQDPGANRLISKGATINLLVSDGRPVPTYIMPDILGKPIQEMLQILAPYNLRLSVNAVDQPDAEFDVVLAQDPVAGSLVREGDRVFYTVRASGIIDLPSAERTVHVAYTVPTSWFEREVRIDTIDRNGTRVTVFPLERHYINGQPPRYSSGTVIELSPTFIDTMTLEVYLDGQLAQSYSFEGDKEPVITQYSVQ